MATKLEESTKSAKKLAIGCGILIVLILVVSFVARLFKGEPPPCIPYASTAQESYKKLPKVKMKTLKLEQKAEPGYELDTIEETLPDLPQIANVYKTKSPIQSLSAYDEAIDIAEEFKFRDVPEQISDTSLKWRSGTKTLKIDKLYHKVTLSTNYKKDKEAVSKHAIDAEQTPYINRAFQFIEKTRVYTSTEIDELDTILTYLKMNKNYKFVKAKSPSDANFVRVDFFKPMQGITAIIPEYCTSAQKKYVQENIDEYNKDYNIHINEPFQGMSYVILGGLKGEEDLYQLRALDWKSEGSSTYSLTPVSEAWNKVKNGEGYLRSIYELNGDYLNSDTSIKVQTFYLHNVDLIYASSTDYIKYLQPVYRFSGQGNIKNSKDKAEFIIYYPAVSNSKK